MIERYSTDAMTELWSDENRYKTWLDVELTVCRAWMEDGLIPPDDLKAIEERASIDVKRINEIENEVHHDVIAFVSSLTEKTGPSGRFIHMGLTSSDVLDTAASVVITRGIDILVSALDALMDGLLRAAWKYRYTPCAGRTHGIHAEPLSFGLKILNWYSEAGRDRERLEAARRHIAVGKISGAVGTYAHCPPHIEERVCELLG
ncbi:MAG: lyase family protein, partial [Synergistota bacterium]|nr:lyase family protein [Synergistota bacterium]